jgi:hypothetical protein
MRSRRLFSVAKRTYVTAGLLVVCISFSFDNERCLSTLRGRLPGGSYVRAQGPTDVVLARKGDGRLGGPSQSTSSENLRAVTNVAMTSPRKTTTATTVKLAR